MPEKIAAPIFLPEAVSIQVYHEILTPPLCRDFWKKNQKFFRILLHLCAYSDILLHISEDIVLCS